MGVKHGTFSQVHPQRGAKGLIFHRGTFLIDREVYTNGCLLDFEQATFDGRLLKDWEAFFNHPLRYFTQDEKAYEIVDRAKWLRDSGSMSIDLGNHQYSIHNTWMSEQNRFRPKAQKEI